MDNNENKEVTMDSIRAAMEQAIIGEDRANEAANAAEESAEATENAAQEAENANATQTEPEPQAASPDVADTQQQTSPDNAPTINQPQQTAQSSDLMVLIQQLMAQNQQLQAQLQQAGNAMQQQSQTAENAVMNQFAPEAAPQAQHIAEDVAPTLDFASMRYMSEEEQAQKMADWQQSVVDYAIRRATEAARSEIAPVRDEYEAKRRIAENDAAKATIYADPRFASFRDRDADIERIIAATPVLNGVDAATRYMLGGLIDRGMNNLQPHEITTEELVQKALASPEVLKALETKRATEIQKQNAEIPTIAPSSGTGNASPIPENKPKSFDDIRARALKRFAR